MRVENEVGEPRRWGILGCGSVAASHAVALSRSRDAVLVAVADTDVGAARTVADRFDAEAFGSIEALLDNAAVDAVTVALPHHLHLEAIEAAAGRGISVLCEKPLGRSAAECRRAIRVAGESSIALGTILNNRGYRSTGWVKRAIAEGRLSPVTVTITANLAATARVPWQEDPLLSGGGVLLTVGVHYIDLLRWWLGEVVEVSAAIPRGVDAVESVAGALLRFETGALATLMVTRVGSTTIPARIEIEGSGARVSLTGSRFDHADAALGELPEAEPDDPELRYGSGHVAVIGAAAAAFASNEPFPISGEDGAASVEICEAIYRKAAERPSNPIRKEGVA